MEITPVNTCSTHALIRPRKANDVLHDVRQFTLRFYEAEKTYGLKSQHIYVGTIERDEFHFPMLKYDRPRMKIRKEREREREIERERKEGTLFCLFGVKKLME